MKPDSEHKSKAKIYSYCYENIKTTFNNYKKLMRILESFLIKNYKNEVLNKVKYMIMMHLEIQKQADALKDLRELINEGSENHSIPSDTISKEDVDSLSDVLHSNASQSYEDSNRSILNSTGDRKTPTEVHHKF